MREAAQIRKLILNYDQPFSYGEIISLLNEKGYNDNDLNNQIIEELHEHGYIAYAKVLPVSEANMGYAFVADCFYEKKLKDYTLNRLSQMGITDPKVINEVLNFASDVASKAYLREEPKTR